MKNIKINNTEYRIPTSWDEISLDKIIQVQRDSNEFDEYTGITETFNFKPDNILKKFSIVSGYCDIDIKDLKKMTLNQATELFKELKFLNGEIPKVPIDKFSHNGHEYYTSQNLSKEEFQDHVSIEMIISRYNENLYEAIPYIAAVICKRRKEDKELESIDDYDIIERADKEFRSLPLPIANSIAVFFYNYEKTYNLSSQLYSNPQILVEAKVHTIKTTLNKLAGKGLLYRLLTSVSWMYIKFLKRGVMKSLNSIQSESSITNSKKTSTKKK